MGCRPPAAKRAIDGIYQFYQCARSTCGGETVVSAVIALMSPPGRVKITLVTQRAGAGKAHLVFALTCPRYLIHRNVSFEATVFILPIFHLFDISSLHSAVLCFPVVIADLDALQNGNDLMFGKSGFTHGYLLRGNNHYVGRFLKENNSFCRESYR